MRILIADDDDIALVLLEDVLGEAGHEVLTASTGVEALELLRSRECRLVIADWEMPQMTGLDLCRAVRAADWIGNYVYFILLTGHDSRESKLAGLSAGADDFITKPFDPEELLVRVRAGERIVGLETRDVAIFAMAKLAESRDPETGLHLERVQRYARTLATDLKGSSPYADQVDEEFVRLVYATSPLHDIGKVGIPDAVLLKAGKLTDREFEIMKTHTVIGTQTLGAALARYPEAKFLRMARDIAGSHHEWWNGSGYPTGLGGPAIPLCARIVAVADVYDALTSKRVYKSAFGHDIAKPIILKESGTHFDPVVVDSFVRCEDQFVGIHGQLSDGDVATGPPAEACHKMATSLAQPRQRR
jgi:putative two-component system response regulator